MTRHLAMHSLGLPLLLAFVLFIISAESADRGNAQAYRFTVGAINATAVSDGSLSFPADAFLPNATQEDLDAALATAHRPMGNLTLYINVLHLEMPGRRVLIDTGGGFPGTGRLVDNLVEAGLDPSLVDVVVITHGHPDHYGGIRAGDGTLAFPNAEYFMSATDFEYWASGAGGDPVAVDVLTGIQNLTTLVEADGDVVVPGITAVFTPGHTPGHMSVEVDGGEGARLLCTGDAVFNELTVAKPGWLSVADLDKEGAVATRTALLRRLSEERTRTFMYHMSFPGLGHINANPKGRSENGGDEESFAWVADLYEF
eukprot:evm.model.scf_2191.3 EVM.evm.TU.scf_2191.3   scf_2191:21789-24510(-)